MANSTKSPTTPADGRNVKMQERSADRVIPGGQPRFVRTPAAALRLSLLPRTLEKHRV